MKTTIISITVVCEKEFKDDIKNQMTQEGWEHNPKIEDELTLDNKVMFPMTRTIHILKQN